MYDAPGTTTDDRTGGRTASRLPWYLAGWLVLSALAVVGALVLNRAPKRTQHPQPAVAPVNLPSDTQAQAPAPAGQATALGSSGWTLHLVFTANRMYYNGPQSSVTGCTSAACTKRGVLGRFPADFVAAVRTEGTGLISPRHYLNYDPQAGYWLDSAARGWGGPPSQAFVSARSLTPLVPLGTDLRIGACGVLHRHDATALCRRLRKATWTVTQDGAPTPGRDLWLYVGLEHRTSAGARTLSGTFRHAILRVG